VALPTFASQTINPALARAHVALFQHCPSFLSPSF
jgi:hypothetical protein